jgi:hypothetical protein
MVIYGPVSLLTQLLMKMYVYLFNQMSMCYNLVVMENPVLI